MGFHGKKSSAKEWEDSAQMVQLLLMHNANVNAQDQVLRVPISEVGQ